MTEFWVRTAAVFAVLVAVQVHGWRVWLLALGLQVLGGFRHTKRTPRKDAA